MSKFRNAYDKNLHLLMVYREYIIPRIIYTLIRSHLELTNLKKHLVLVDHIYAGSLNNGNEIVFIEMKKMVGEDLEIPIFSKFVWNLRYNICLQIFFIVSSLNRLKIMHGDVKPDNFKFDKKTEKVRIFDFGFSCIVTKNPNELQYRLQNLYFKNLQCAEKYIGSKGYISPAIRVHQQKKSITSKFIFLKELYALTATCYVLLSTEQFDFETNELDFLDEEFPLPKMGILFFCVLRAKTWKEMLDNLHKFEVIPSKKSKNDPDQYHLVSTYCYEFLSDQIS